MSTAEPAGLPSVAELARLANEFFKGLPGQDAAPALTVPPVPSFGVPAGLPVPDAAVPTVPPVPDAGVPAGLPVPGAGGALPSVEAHIPLIGSAPVDWLDALTLPGEPSAALAGVPDVAQAAQTGQPEAPRFGAGSTDRPDVPAAPDEPPASPVPVPTAAQLAGVPETLTGVMGTVAGLPDGIEALPAAERYDNAAVPSPTAAIPSAVPLAPSASPARQDAASVLVFEFSPQMVPSLDQTSAAARPFDPVAVRRDFPILSERVNGKRLVWLDNGATTQKPQAVIDRLSYFYEHENSNIHRAAHTLAARATDAYEGARSKVSRYLNADDAGRIVFVRGATEGVNLIAQSWGAAHVRAGDEVLITHLEHHANIVPWQQLCQRVGAKLVVAPVDDTGQIILSEFARLVSPRTKIAAMTAVSNALGTVTPLPEMIEIVHRAGAKVLVDAAQSIPHMRVDVAALGCDFLTFSGHKVFAPTGIGVVYGTKAAWEETPPWQGGGNMIADVTFDRTVYQGPPNRFEAGTGNIADAVGLGAALDYVSALGIDAVTAYEHELLEYGTQCLHTVPGLRIIGTASRKASILSFVLKGHDPVEVGAALDKEGIAVRAGHHCAQPILRRFGVEATVRPALALYNTREDIDLLTAALHRIADG